MPRRGRLEWSFKFLRRGDGRVFRSPFGSLCGQSRQKSLKRPGDNSVYRTVCWMFLWPR
jgi:hypothetical protein